MAIPEDARHSQDFCSVVWNGVEYSFSPMQAAIVAMLWEAQANDTPDVHASTLLARADSELKVSRLDPLFFRHPAWKTVIVRGKRRGTYRLDPTTDSSRNNTIFPLATVVLQIDAINKRILPRTGCLAAGSPGNRGSC